ncbi:hypothetical protein PTTG_10362 [Puccinia triticina 1-1 BBBD Race 1]|uniref:Uncharacterized protein n=1 Tax=Puccinia triticina (isolate 1-1 / race 1 (BBBD)) TaxID=630390 RepID=A0A0C4FAW9_PUCT1|nr:hypothetical protein PTTG_10362 [Puccinia triticina 1-1 BBBD Race 1]
MSSSRSIGLLESSLLIKPDPSSFAPSPLLKHRHLNFSHLPSCNNPSPTAAAQPQTTADKAEAAQALAQVEAARATPAITFAPSPTRGKSPFDEAPPPYEGRPMQGAELPPHMRRTPHADRRRCWPTPDRAPRRPCRPSPYHRSSPPFSPLAHRSSSPSFQSSPPSLGPEGPTPSNEQYSAAFFAHSFVNFLHDLRTILDRLPPNHPDAQAHNLIRMDATLLEHWYRHRADQLVKMFSNPYSNAGLVYRTLVSTILRLGVINSRHAYDLFNPAL